MAVNIFGEQMHDNCCVMVKSRRQNWRCGLTKCQGNSFFAPYRCHLRNRKYLELRIWQCLAILGTHALIHSLSKTLRFRRIDKTNLNALVGKIILEQIPGANIKIVELTKFSPTCAKFCTEKAEAVYLEDTASAATQLLIALIHCSSTSFVGFMISV